MSWLGASGLNSAGWSGPHPASLRALRAMETFVKVATRDELPPGGKKLVEVDGRAIAVFHVCGGFYAIDDVCTHDGGPLAEGQVIGCEIQCPRHGARFDIRTGRP